MKTVLNRNIISHRDQPLFLGEDLSLQRYDNPKHKVFLDLFNKQLEFFWRPEEISIAKDRNDFQALQEHEKFIFTSNLKFQTMLDSVISRGANTLLEYVSNPELEACINVWQMFETIHSYAYTYIIQNVYPNPSEILDSILEDQEILKRAETVTRDYDLLKVCGDDVKRQIYLTLVSINILEAVRFYVSFVCAFAFGENKTMIGNADIIKLIKRDEGTHLQITQSILNILRSDPSEGFQDTIKECEVFAVQMFAEAAEEEKAWANYLFSKGSLRGLNANILHGYIEWLCNNRMKNIGLPELFPGAKNNIRGWIDNWFGSENQFVQVAPQESEIISYKISASTNDLDNLEF